MNLSHPEMNRRKRAGPTARGCGLVTVLATALTTPDPAAAQGPHDAVLSGEVGAYTVTGRSFEAWGRILGDEVMAAALVDRLLHRCHIVNDRGTATGCDATRNSRRRSARWAPE